MPWAHDRLWTIAGGQMLGLGWEKDRFLMSTEGALRPFVAGLASLLLGYMPARTHSSQSADLVTGGGATSLAQGEMLVRRHKRDWFTDALIAVGVALIAVGIYGGLEPVFSWGFPNQ
jgi:hypothetical protein